MRIFIFFFIVITLSILHSCGIPDPKPDDCVGNWASDDTSSFIFNKDGTFSSDSLSGEKMFERVEYINKRYSEKGTWKLKNQSGKWILELVFYKIGESNGKVGTQLYVAGKNGIASNKPPWYLFKYIGDPDDGKMYEFQKNK